VTRPIASVLAVACLLAAIAGCGDSAPAKKVLNTEAVERSIEKSIKEQRKLDSSVTCPVNIEQKKGNDFTCFADVKGKRFEFKVTQTDDDGHVTYVGV